VRAAIAAAAVLAAAAGPLVGQEPPRRWLYDGEVGASLSFGATDQVAFTVRSAVDRRLPRVDLLSKWAFDYGEAAEPGKEARVTKRSWGVQVRAPIRTRSGFDPFVSLGGSGSFQQAVDLRVTLGGGVRFRPLDGERTELSVALSGLYERTEPRRSGPEVADPAVEELGRLAADLSFRRRMGERTELSLSALYKPDAADFADFTVESETALTFALNGFTSLKFSLADRYDSRATARGATSNNDGRFYVSLIASNRD